MTIDAEKLYSLLPAFDRIQDQRIGGPLRALLSVISEQAEVLDENLNQLYDDQFIETCADWVVPYIGELIGVRGVPAAPDSAFSHRAQVANTIGYRRRKGTASVLEQLARDVTGWSANVVEYFQRLGTTQYMNHVRPGNLATPDLRQFAALELTGTPFDPTPHTLDVRQIASGRGKYNIPNIGVFLWRVASYPVTQAPASRVDARRYRFDALGRDVPLFNRVREENGFSLATRENVPAPLSRRVLDRDKNLHYAADGSVFLSVDGAPVSAADVIVCNLSDQGADWSGKSKDRFVIDPALGRLTLPENANANAKVQVTYHYGFTANIGGGEYPRASTFDAALQPVIHVPADHATLQEALNQAAVSGGVIEIADNARLEETLTTHVAAGKKVELRSAEKRRAMIVLGAEWEISGGADAEFILNGLLISGAQLHAPAKVGADNNEIAALRLRHCTLASGGVASGPSVLFEAPNALLAIESSILGAVQSSDETTVNIANSILDAGASTAAVYAGAPLTVQNSTLIGTVHTMRFDLASNSIFHAAAPVIADRLQQGCVRFCYLPFDSVTPRRYRCQPANAADASRIRPVFTSLRSGDPGYCQLDPRCPSEIASGADDGAEMGAFHDLFQPQRESDLRARLKEYLRFGLEAGIFHAS